MNDKVDDAIESLERAMLRYGITRADLLPEIAAVIPQRFDIAGTTDELPEVVIISRRERFA